MNIDNFPIAKKTLGATYSKSNTIFRAWSPLRDQIELLLYRDSSSVTRRIYKMTKGEDGVHEVMIDGNLAGYFYTYLVEEKWEITDPYSLSASMNSIRSAIIDLKDTNPPGWASHSRPKASKNHTPIIYEVHIKDFTAHISSGVKNRGKYLGFVEKAPLNHLKELGVTHIHLMPVYDFLTVREEDEYFLNDKNYNWGYDPELYNVPEGSYSTDSQDPILRIKELKTLIMKLHEAGLKVVLDVVYNHTYRSEHSNFNILMPNYYYRFREDGSFSDGAGCGNEFASERYMARRFILDSVKYWVNEYGVDGFRFDLMALLDFETIEELVEELRKINPDILIYGEPWTAGQTTLSDHKQTSKGRQQKLGFAFFNDRFRDAIKGDNDGLGKGFIQGNIDSKLSVETGIAGSIYYDNSHIGFTTKSNQSINYVNSHDNLIIRDKIKRTLPYISFEDEKVLNKFAFSILFTSQGIPFFHAGNEFLRTKFMEGNSYNLPLTINAIDWTYKNENIEYFKYFKDLIALRKKYSEFNLINSHEIKNRLKFMKIDSNSAIIAYSISMIDEGGCLLIVHNPYNSNQIISKNTILEHINTNCNPGHEIESIVNIFNTDGLVKGEEDISFYHGIEIPLISTMVYKVKLKSTINIPVDL